VMQNSHVSISTLTITYRLVPIDLDCNASKYILANHSIYCTYGHSQLKTGHPVRSAIHKQLNGRLVLRWVTTWESLLLYVLHFFSCFSFHVHNCSNSMSFLLSRFDSWSMVAFF
jgi:hypothetical protein